MKRTPEVCKKISEGVAKAWQNPEHRAKMRAIQMKNGYRSYGSTLNPKPKESRYKAPTLTEYLHREHV